MRPRENYNNKKPEEKKVFVQSQMNVQVVLVVVNFGFAEDGRQYEGEFDEKRE